MDFWSLVIILSILASAVALVVGPLMELRGKMLFVDQPREPVVKGRIGMGVMALSATLFTAGLILRVWFESAFVTPIVIGGYLLWFVGGIIAVVRNESLRVMTTTRG